MVKAYFRAKRGRGKREREREKGWGEREGKYQLEKRSLDTHIQRNRWIN